MRMDQYLALILAVLIASSGCAIFQDEEAREVREHTYRQALGEMLQGHTYEMQCRALLPLAEEELWRQGYSNVEYREGRMGLNTRWERQAESRSRREVHAQEVGLDQCALQVLRRRVTETEEERMRDVWLEFKLLDSIDKKEADQLRTRAREQAREAVRK